MKIAFTILCLTMISFSCFSQNENYGTGALIDSLTFSKIPKVDKFQGAKSKRSKAKYSLRKYCPLPGNQKNTNSCVAWATGYSAMTIIDAIQFQKKNKEEITREAFSPSFIFNQVSDKNCSGALISDAFELLKEKGDCRHSTFNNPMKNCSELPQPKAIQEASFHKIKDYAAIFYSNDDGMKTKVGKTIDIVSQDNPVIVIMQVTKSLRDIKIGNTTWSPQQGEVKETIGHAMVVTGYNRKTRQFELMNSWGTNWGDEGFIWVSFEDFARYAQYGFILIPNAWTSPEEKNNNTIANINNNSTRRIQGEFQLIDESKTGDSFNNEKLMLDPKNSYYRTPKNSWKPQSSFRVKAKNITKNTYLYLFSINPEGEINYLYPLLKDMDTGHQLSHFIPGDSIELVYPPDDDVFYLESVGTDYLGVLISWNAIENVENKINSLSDFEGSITDRLQKIFKDELVPSKNIQFEIAKMKFEYEFSLPLNKNIIVPLVIAIQTSP